MLERLLFFQYGLEVHNPLVNYVILTQSLVRCGLHEIDHGSDHLAITCAQVEDEMMDVKASNGKAPRRLYQEVP